MALHRNCEQVTRRDCLKLGLGGLLSGGLVGALRSQAIASTTGQRAANACILIWMDGGPSHYETFDPKPDAPVEIRGEFESIATKLTGVRFSKHMTRLGQLTDKLAIIRSIRHDQGNHGAGNHYMMTGGPSPDSGRLRCLCQLSPKYGFGRRTGMWSSSRLTRVFLDAGNVPLRRTQFPRSPIRPVRRRR